MIGAKDAERCTDAIDEGTKTAQLFLDIALDAQRDKLAPETHPDFDGAHCVEPDCGVVLPLARLALRRIRCIDCQTLIEERQRHFQR